MKKVLSLLLAALFLYSAACLVDSINAFATPVLVLVQCTNDLEYMGLLFLFPFCLVFALFKIRAMHQNVTLGYFPLLSIFLPATFFLIILFLIMFRISGLLFDPKGNTSDDKILFTILVALVLIACPFVCFNIFKKIDSFVLSKWAKKDCGNNLAFFQSQNFFVGFVFAIFLGIVLISNSLWRVDPVHFPNFTTCKEIEGTT